MNGPLPITPRLVIPESDLRMAWSRSGGAGGQHVNTADTRVQLWFDLEGCDVLFDAVKDRIRAAHHQQINSDGELYLACSTHRSRYRNVQEVRERLASLIRAQLKPPRKRRATQPTRASQRRRVDTKKHRGKIKQARGKVQRDD